MPRPADSSIRLKLRDDAVEYVLRYGLSDLSLRPLAKHLGTHARMLVYHFGSREQLMKAILEGLRDREDEAVQAWFRAGGSRGRTITDFVRWYWSRLGSPAARPAVALIFELYALALRDPDAYPGVLQDPVAYWESLLERSGVKGRVEGKTTATLLLAAVRGLLLDMAATGDHARVNRAMSKLLKMIEQEQS